MTSFFSIAGIQAASAQFLGASLGVQFGIVVAVLASVALISFLAYKLYKKVTGPKASARAPEEQMSEQLSTAAETKPGLGQRLKNWWNRSTIINGIDKKVEDLNANFQKHTSSSQKSLESLSTDVKTVDSKLNTKLDEKLAQLNTLFEQSKSEAATKIETLEKRLAKKLNTQASAVEATLQTAQEQSTSQLKALDDKVNGLDSRTTAVEGNTAILNSKMQAFEQLRGAVDEVVAAGAVFNRMVSRSPSALPLPLTMPPISAANEEGADGVVSDEEEAVTLSSSRAAASSPRAR